MIATRASSFAAVGCFAVTACELARSFTCSLSWASSWLRCASIASALLRSAFAAATWS